MNNENNKFLGSANRLFKDFDELYNYIQKTGDAELLRNALKNPIYALQQWVRVRINLLEDDAGKLGRKIHLDLILM